MLDTVADNKIPLTSDRLDHFIASTYGPDNELNKMTISY